MKLPKKEHAGQVDEWKISKSTKKPNVDEQKTYQWVRKTVLKAETEEDLLILDQDQSFETRCYHCNKIKYSNTVIN